MRVCWFSLKWRVGAARYSCQVSRIGTGRLI